MTENDSDKREVAPNHSNSSHDSGGRHGYLNITVAGARYVSKPEKRDEQNRCAYQQKLEMHALLANIRFVLLALWHGVYFPSALTQS